MGRRVSSQRKSLIARMFGSGQKALINEDQWRDSSWMNSIPSYDGGYISYAKLYRSQPAVRQVVSFIAENVAQVPIKQYQRVSDVERKAVSDHPVARMLENPNPGLSQFEFIRDLVTDLEVFDVAYYQIARSKGEMSLGRLYPDAVRPKNISMLGPQSFEVTRSDGTVTTLDAKEVLFVSGYDGGISPLETLRRLIAEDTAAGVYREGMYRNGMRNAGVIERPLEAPDWSDNARARFLEQLAARHTGASATGRPLLLEEGMAWKSDQIKFDSSEYVAERELNTRAVANAYRISPVILGLESAPFASITAYNQQLYQNALAPRLVHLTQALERQLLAPAERTTDKFYLEFNLSAKLRGSFVEQAAIAAAAVGGPFMTVDEYRAMIELPPLDDAQKAELGAIAGVPQEGAPNTGAGATDQPAPSEPLVDVPKQRAKAKPADRGLNRRRDKFAADVEDAMQKAVDRLSKAKSLSKSRISNEIAADVRPVLERHVTAEAARKAAQLGGEFDPKYVQHYLDKSAENVGVRVAVAYDAVKERHGDDKEAIKTAMTDTSKKTSLTVATALVAFAREEAGKQSGAGTKSWIVTSSDSRHADLDGETVKLGQPFSNGMAYPGDPSADPEETVNCQCLLDIS